jgi:hypothetical protein
MTPRTEPGNFCRLLRTKMGYFRDPAGNRMIDADSNTACYTCLRTLKPYGPDDLPVDAHSCTTERACFEEEI